MKTFIRLSVAGVILATLLLAALSVYLFLPLAGTRGAAFTIPQGATLRATANELARAGVIPDTIRFELLARVRGKSTAVQAGNYVIDDPLSPVDLLELITGREGRQEQITVLEGWTVRDLREALEAHPGLRHDTSGMAEDDLLRTLGATSTALEGLFFPDTYRFSPGSSDLSILKRAKTRMESTLAEYWEQRASDLPLQSAYHALILASIVEKETSLDSDRAMVAGVLVNRLRIGMRLQTDPTVIYGMGAAFDGDLRRRDLERDSPFNTYTRAGLPPTPISLPGKASIAAAVRPAQTKAMYFVARGDGTSQFSATLPEHNRAVSRFQRKLDREGGR